MLPKVLIVEDNADAREVLLIQVEQMNPRT